MVCLDMHLLIVMLLFVSGHSAKGKNNSTESVRLVGGRSHCEGTLEMKHQGEWRQVTDLYSAWALKAAAGVCRELNCGSAMHVTQRVESSVRPVWAITYDCVKGGSPLRKCAKSHSSPITLALTCSDAVRLVDGPSLCSGRLEVKSEKSNRQWSSVCEANFDQQDAEVVCRELGCGAPSVLQGALYGEAEAPMWTRAFKCGGHESALLDCRSSDSAGKSCSPAEAVGLTCSEPVRLVGASRCAGTLEVEHQGAWRPVGDIYHEWSRKDANVACKELGCGFAAFVQWRESSVLAVWKIASDCVQSGSTLRECATLSFSLIVLDVTCSDPTALIIRAVLLPLTLLLVNIGMYFYCKATRGQRPRRQKNTGLGGLNPVSADERPTEEEGAQGAK